MPTPTPDDDSLPISDADVTPTRPGRKTVLVAVAAVAAVFVIINLPAIKDWVTLHF